MWYYVVDCTHAVNSNSLLSEWIAHEDNFDLNDPMETGLLLLLNSIISDRRLDDDRRLLPFDAKDWPALLLDLLPS